MLTLEELLEQRRDIEELKFRLQKYQSEIRFIGGEISGITYRLKSGIDTRDSEIQRKNSLKKQLREKMAELRWDCNITPRFIDKLISECDSYIIGIDMKIDSLERQKQGQQEGKQQDTCEAALQGIAEAYQRLQRFHEQLAVFVYDSLYDEPEDGEQEQERESPDPNRDR